jgi:type IV pilus assembly protein PilW
LMVSLAIGLLIVTAAFSAYLGASGAGKAAESQGRMNEDAQAALTILVQQLRMAGNNPQQADRSDKAGRNPVYSPYPGVFIPLPASFSLSAFSLRGCDGKFSNLAMAGSLDALTCAPGSNASPDSIAASYEADAFNSIAATDCLGAALSQINATFVPPESSNGPYFVSGNVFYIDTSTSIVSPSLYCKGNGIGSVAQPLVENIEDLQLSYGVVKSTTAAADVSTAAIAGYLRADEVISQSAMAALADDAERWSKVIAVRICVLVRSERPVVTDAVSARYLQCDGTMNTAPPDLRLRRAYYATVVMRNRRL